MNRNFLHIGRDIEARSVEIHVADDVTAMQPSDWLGTDPALFVYRADWPTSCEEVFTREVPLRGRYVRARMVKDNTDDLFCFAELQVFGEYLIESVVGCKDREFWYKC